MLHVGWLCNTGNLAASVGRARSKVPQIRDKALPEDGNGPRPGPLHGRQPCPRMADTAATRLLTSFCDLAVGVANRGANLPPLTCRAGGQECRHPVTVRTLENGRSRRMQAATRTTPTPDVDRTPSRWQPSDRGCALGGGACHPVSTRTLAIIVRLLQTTSGRVATGQREAEAVPVLNDAGPVRPGRAVGAACPPSRTAPAPAACHRLMRPVWETNRMDA